MSSDTDLTSVFGRPARDLSQRLGRNPRRSRHDDDANPVDNEAEQMPGRVVVDTAKTTTSDTSEPVGTEGRGRHLAPAPDTAAHAPGAAPREDTDRAAPSSPAPGGADGPTSTSSPERATPPRPRRPAAGARGRGSSRTPSPTELDPSTSYQVPVYVHPGVRTAATTLRKTEKLTNAEVAFNAIDEVQHRLAGLIRDRRLQARPDSSLFPGRVRRGRLSGGGAATPVGEVRRVLWGFRATGAELEIIDRLVADNGAESRSELVAVALEETLLR